MKLVYTVKSSGTFSLKAQLGGDVDIAHLDQEKNLDDFDEIHTTYRDPKRVAATWANHHAGLFSAEEWCQQWSAWSHLDAIVHPVTELAQHLHSTPDTLGLHKALDDGDMEYFHSYVPEHLITFAHQCAGNQHG